MTTDGHHDTEQAMPPVPTPAPSPAMLALIYDQLRQLARNYFASMPHGHTLQPTALVHEAFLKICTAMAADSTKPGAHHWSMDRDHFFAVAATAMRQVLIDAARGRAAIKRGGAGLEYAVEPPVRVALDSTLIRIPRLEVDVLELDDALQKYAKFEPRGAHIVELRFFGGLTGDQVADLLGISRSTVTTEWKLARAWLARELGPDDAVVAD